MGWKASTRGGHCGLESLLGGCWEGQDSRDSSSLEMAMRLLMLVPGGGDDVVVDVVDEEQAQADALKGGLGLHL